MVETTTSPTDNAPLLPPLFGKYACNKPLQQSCPKND
jgi:hypothetical protein